MTLKTGTENIGLMSRNTEFSLQNQARGEIGMGGFYPPTHGFSERNGGTWKSWIDVGRFLYKPFNMTEERVTILIPKPQIGFRLNQLIESWNERVTGIN
jgi:hypothetical protein